MDTEARRSSWEDANNVVEREDDGVLVKYALRVTLLRMSLGNEISEQTLIWYERRFKVIEYLFPVVSYLYETFLGCIHSLEQTLCGVGIWSVTEYGSVFYFTVKAVLLYRSLDTDLWHRALLNLVCKTSKLFNTSDVTCCFSGTEVNEIWRPDGERLFCILLVFSVF